MTPEQHAALIKAAGEMTSAFPGLSLRDVVEGPLALIACGPVPPYSGLTHHRLTNVSTATVGAFVLCYGYDKTWRENAVVLIRRAETSANGTAMFGATGGYTVIDGPSGEQPREGAVRETGEELIDDTGQPVIALPPERLRILDDGMDYRAAAKNGLPTHYTAFAARLTARELTRVRRHAHRMDTDAAYRAAVNKHSKGEVSGVVVLRLSEAAQMTHAQFTHPHELAAVRLLSRAVARNARQHCPATTKGYSMG